MGKSTLTNVVKVTMMPMRKGQLKAVAEKILTINAER